MKWKKYHPNEVTPHTHVLVKDEHGGIFLGKFDSAGAFHDHPLNPFTVKVKYWTILDMPEQEEIHHRLEKSVENFENGDGLLRNIFNEMIFAIKALEEKINGLG